MRASATVILGAWLTPVGGLRARGQRAVLDAVERGDEQRRAGGGEPVEQLAGGVPRPDRLGEDPVHGPGVQARVEPERGGAGDLVARPDRGLHRRGAAPRGQQREVQVDPAVPRDPEDGGPEQRPVGDDDRRVRGPGAQRRAKGRGLPRTSA